MSTTNAKKVKKPSEGFLPVKVMKQGDIWAKLSVLFMGIANLRRKQIVKGLFFLLSEAAFIWYMVSYGALALSNMTTLGTQTQGWVFDEAKGIDVLAEGDNSMLLLLYGIVAIFIVIAFILVWRANLKSALEVQALVKKGHKVPGFIDDVKTHFDSKFHRTMLAIPMAGVIAFTVLPLVYMILVAFTNYDNAHQPPGNLFTWIGLDNFKTILASGESSQRPSGRYSDGP